MFRAWFLIGLLFSFPAAASEVGRQLTGTAAVRDGDSLHVDGVAVRLFGIDAPERNQDCDLDGKTWDCGVWARGVLEGAIGGRSLQCEVVDTDRYGRSVATCRVAGEDLARLLVLTGAASAYTRYSDRYTGEEALARAAGRGIWGGRMVAPAEYRAHGATPDVPAANGCRIKGNISSNGRIYHMPGQRDYDRTRISPVKGEAWFCSADEARASGFRPARR